MSFQGSSSDDYDPAAFYCGAADEHGHVVDKRFRISPVWLARIQDLLSTGVFLGTPIGASMDRFIRDAMVHDLYRLAALKDDPRVLALADEWRQSAIVDQLMLQMRAREELIEKVDTAIERAIQVQDEITVEALVEVYGEVELPVPFGAKLQKVVTRGRKWLESRAE